jgi:hypothetical protein
VSNPTFYFHGLQVSELNLFISDLIMATTALVCWLRLKNNLPALTAQSYYHHFFLFTMLATSIAGFGHLLNLYTGIYLKLIGWFFSTLANYYFILASLQFDTYKNNYNGYKKLAALKLLVAIIFLFLTKVFVVISIDTTISIGLVVLPIHFLEWKKTKMKGYLWICIGILFTMLTGLVSVFNLSISETWFNAKDLNHIIISGGLYLIYKGLTKLQ